MSPAFHHQPLALLVLTSHSLLGSTGRNTGYTVSEAADPWRVFTDAGWGVHLASVAGGCPPEDALDLSEETQAAWKNDPAISHQLSDTPTPDHTNAAIYDVVYFVGGHGAMWDFPGNAGLSTLGASVYERGKVVAAVCHGPAVLTSLQLSDGTLLAAGRSVAAFTDAEEEAIGLDTVVPFPLETRLRELGATMVTAPLWQENVVTDGRLVTGQNPASAAGVARAAIAASGRS